jgi:hypothetical protein
MSTNHVDGKIREMLKKLPFGQACDLHARLAGGRLGIETRQLVQDALRKADMHRAQAWR